MEQINAVVVDPAAAGKFSIRSVDTPAPAASEALIRLSAISLNLGEIRRARSAKAGWRPGWDLAGTVEKAAADGSGPRAGERVVGMMVEGAWAELVAVPSHALASLPRAVSFEHAATLPVAGLTALYALEKNGPIKDKHILITGASGGVGHLACQLATHGGAHVVGAVRRPEREKNAREAGADAVVAGEDLSSTSRHGPYDLILESVGRKSLTAALTMLAQDGMCVLYGASENPEVTIDARRLYMIGGATLYGFILFHELKRHPAGQGLARLPAMVAEGFLRPQIEVKAPWTEIGQVAEDLWLRRIAGKAVLTL